MVASLSVDGVSLTYDNGYQALRDVSISVQAGEFATLLGPSGCGKTTLLRVIAGFLQPTGGSVSIAGADVTSLPPEKRDTAMVFQSYALFPHMTVTGNIDFGLKQQKLSASERKDRIDTALNYVDMDTQREKRPAALSGGQQQRVALARALALQPGLVLYDEPLSNLDAKLREQVRFELRRLQQDFGFTSVYVTHDQAEALAMSDVVYLMNHGEIVQAGKPQDIYQNPTTRFVADFLGVANIFEARVLRSSGHEHTVSTPFGELTVKSERQPSAQHLYMCWRPEDVEVVDPGKPTPANTFDFTVTESVFLGNLVDIFGQVDGDDTTFRVQLLQRSGLEPGSRQKLAVDPTHLQFLEPVGSSE